MLYNYQGVIVILMLLPVVLYILLPLAMLALWLLKYVIIGGKKQTAGHENGLNPAKVSMAV